MMVGNNHHYPVNPEVNVPMKCPNCQSKDIGKIGINQYYCWGCYIELSLSKGVIHTHQVEEDGSLSSLDDLFDEEERRLS
ncbi:hypothetical protein B0G93_104213 [Bacillus sp. V-88]|nr:hypothetical protein B0G93_104213 [Bacillus sp. V-88]SLK19198.1 hypothetical protein SAMN06295884_104213 [Bacillus sp. V-88]